MVEINTGCLGRAHLKRNEVLLLTNCQDVRNRKSMPKV